MIERIHLPTWMDLSLLGTVTFVCASIVRPKDSTVRITAKIDIMTESRFKVIWCERQCNQHQQLY